MGGVAVAIVDVVGVILVGDCLMPAAFAVGVLMAVVGQVGVTLALVPVPLVGEVGVAVVEEVGVVAVFDGDMPAVIPVGVWMLGVSVVGCAHG
jgi:hypothetical protein